MRRIESGDCLLIEGDAFRAMKSLAPQSVDLVFADPPYFLSGGGITCQAGRQVNVNKGQWDIAIPIKKKIAYNRRWIRLARTLLKDDGSLWVSGTLHNIYAVGVALELEGFSIINNVTWQKPNPPPNLGCRCFTNSTETILWARKTWGKKKGRHFFAYQMMKEENGGRQMKDVWVFKAPSKREKKHGKHPAQKPVDLLLRIVKSSSKPGDIVLDPFMGSGSSGVAALHLGRRYIGIEKDRGYFALALKRIAEEREEER